MKIKKEEYKFNSDNKRLRKIVFIVVYAITENGPEYLIMHRVKRWKGWEIPKGGKLRFESYKKTVKRELFEETGLKSKKIRKFNTFGEYFFKRKIDDFPGIDGQAYKLYSAKVNKGKIKISDEHSGSKWLSYGDARNLIKFKNQKDCLEEVNKWLIKRLK